MPTGEESPRGAGWRLATPAPEDTFMILREHDRGRTIEVAVGSVVTLELEEIPGSGFRWEIESAGQLESEDASYAGGDSQAPGAARVRVFQFRAMHPGLQTIRMKNVRAWADDVSGRFEVTISVQEPRSLSTQ